MAQKRTSKKTTAAKRTVSKKPPRDINSDIRPSFTIQNTAIASLNKKYIIAAIVVIIILAILYAARSLFIAAIVNGHPISRLSVVNQLETQGGKQALDGLITQTLIEDEASKRNINVSQADVNKQIASIQQNIESQGSSLDAALAQQGMTKNDLNEQVKLQLLLNKMIGTPSVTSKEIDAYISQNKAQLPQNESDATLRNQVKQQIIQQKQQQASQSFVAALRNKAHIVYFVNYQ